MWNSISYLYSSFTWPTIGSPVQFQGDFGMSLSEHSFCLMNDAERREYLGFCYPEEMEHRDAEIACDRRYFPGSSLLIIRKSGGTIIGSVQLVHRDRAGRLPIEFALLPPDSAGCARSFNVEKDAGPGKAVEIYRLRRSFAVDSHQAPMLVTMLFKAIWAKIIETGTRFLHLSYDADSAHLGNLYRHRLDFRDTGKRVRYPGSEKEWAVLRKDCLEHELEYAGKSPRNFYFQTYCRAHLKRKRYRVPALP